MIANTDASDVCYYPDSRKVLVERSDTLVPRQPAARVLGRRIVIARAIACAAIALAATTTSARADSSTDLGVFTAIFGGTHVGFANPVPVSGVVPGAALELRSASIACVCTSKAFRPSRRPAPGSGSFGTSSASLSLLNSTVMVDLDAHRYFRVGAGYQLVNLTNKNGDNGDRNDVRIASPTFAFASTLPLATNHFVETQVLLDPNLRGNLLVFDYLGHGHPSEPEEGAEVDYGAAYGIAARHVTYLIGARALSYHTKNVRTGALVDRNTGAGATFEARFHLGGD